MRLQSESKLVKIRRHVARDFAHAAFDTLWRSGRITKRKAYVWLEHEMGLPVGSNWHMGVFTEPECRRVVELCVRFALHDVSDIV